MQKLIEVYSTVEVSANVAAVAAGSPVAQFRPPIDASLVRPSMMGLTRLEVQLTTAVATRLTLTRGATQSTPTAAGTFGLGLYRASIGNGGFSSNSDAGNLLTAWTVAPTNFLIGGVPTRYRQESIAATIGAKFVWEWPQDDPFSSEFLYSTTANFAFGLNLWNEQAGATGAMIINARWSCFPKDSA